MAHYMIDFKTICRIECDQIDRDKPAPAGTKILQLKAYVRQEMRDKLSFYFGRTPEEDQAYVSS